MKINGLCGTPKPNPDHTQTVFLQTNFGKQTQATLAGNKKHPKLYYGNPETFPEPHGPVITVPAFPQGLYLTLPEDTRLARNDYLQLELSPSRLPKTLTTPVILTREDSLKITPAKQHIAERIKTFHN